MKIVGVPKTIDNDLSATEVTFGFDTALHTATDAVDKIHTTAESHHRVMVVEVMGRDAGWIALEAGIAGGAHIILIPEIPFTIQKLCEHLAMRERYGKRFTIVVVAEGVKLPPEMRHMARSMAVGNMVGDAIALMAQKRSARQRPRPHSARRFAFALRPGASHALRSRRRRPDRHRPIRQNGLPPAGVHQSGKHHRRRRQDEDSRSGRRDRARRSSHRHCIRRLTLFNH